MTTLHAHTKKAKHFIWAFNNPRGFWLSDVYKSASSAKERAWNYCYNLMGREKGTNFRITSHNSFGFTVMWHTADGSGIRVETPNNSYLITR